MHDSPRFHGKPQPDATIFGPGGEAWYCGGKSWSQWVRDDDRRKREAAARALEAERAKEAVK